MDIQILETVGVLGTAIATIALVILLWKAIKQMESTVKLSKLQTEVRFRPWIGPSSKLYLIGENSEGKLQYEIIIKNFGEIPAQSVSVFYKSDTAKISKENLVSSELKEFNLGPVLPNMEKKYWIFIDKELMDKVKYGTEKLFTLLYIEYHFDSNKSAYGMISEYDAEKDLFIHRDMWIDNSSKIRYTSN